MDEFKTTTTRFKCPTSKQDANFVALHRNFKIPENPQLITVNCSNWFESARFVVSPEQIWRFVRCDGHLLVRLQRQLSLLCRLMLSLRFPLCPAQPTANRT